MNTAMQAEFDTFWHRFPRRIGKLAAQKAYEKARKLATAEQILEGVALYRRYKPAWQAWAHPTSWLNQGRYLDEYETTPAAPTETLDEYLASIGHYSAECKRIHGGSCQSGNEHYAKVEAEQQKASA